MKIGYLIPLLCLTACAQYPEHYQRPVLRDEHYEHHERQQVYVAPRPVVVQPAYPVQYPQPVIVRQSPQPVYVAPRPVVMQPSYPVARPVAQPVYTRGGAPRRYEGGREHGHHH